MGRLKDILTTSSTSDLGYTGHAFRLLKSLKRRAAKQLSTCNCTTVEPGYSRVDVREPNSFQPLAEEQKITKTEGDKIKKEEVLNNITRDCDSTRMLNHCLRDLDTLRMNLRKTENEKFNNFDKIRDDKNIVTQKKRNRCSIINLELIQDDEMVEILKDLSDLQSEFEEEIQSEREKQGCYKGTVTRDMKVPLVSKNEEEEWIKDENIRIAIEKIKKASVKKLFIKVFTVDGYSKSLLVDENMTVAQVNQIMAEKNLVNLSPLWALVELVPELYIERVYEDHELLVDNCLLWKADSKNTLWFMERPEKFDIFHRPEKYILRDTTPDIQEDLEYKFDEELFEEFFSGLGTKVLEVEGYIWLKFGAKKSWKKYYCVLRSSGLYYATKKKKSSELIFLTSFDVNQVYYGVGWMEKFKAPTEFCFGVKHPKIQAKNNRNMKYFCVDTEMELHKWVTGIRFAKNGQALCDDYHDILEDIAHRDIDDISMKRCSVNSTECLKIFTNNCGITNTEEKPVLTPGSENKSFDSAISSMVFSGNSVQSLKRKSLEQWETDVSLYASSSSGCCISEESSLSGLIYPPDEDSLPLPPPPNVDSLTSLHGMEPLPTPPLTFLISDHVLNLGEKQSYQDCYDFHCSIDEGEGQKYLKPYKALSSPNISNSYRRISFDENVRVIQDETQTSEKLSFDKRNNHHTFKDNIAHMKTNQRSFNPVNDQDINCGTYGGFGRSKNTFKTFFEDVWFEESDTNFEERTR